MVIRDFLTDYLKIENPQIVSDFSALAEIRHVHKGELIFQEEQEPTMVAFIINCILRGFFVDCTGKDITDCFCWKFGEPAVPTLPLNAAAKINMEAIREGDLLCFPVAPVIDLLENDSSITRLYNSMLLLSLHKHITTKKMLYQYTAVQKYEWFLREYPGLDGIISSKYIASFLGITPVTLSRARREIREKKALETLDGSFSKP